MFTYVHIYTYIYTAPAWPTHESWSHGEAALGATVPPWAGAVATTAEDGPGDFLAFREVPRSDALEGLLLEGGKGVQCHMGGKGFTQRWELGGRNHRGVVVIAFPNIPMRLSIPAICLP